MTPGARVAAAIEILDQIVTGDAAERVLTTWARQHRFAGSGDRAAIRDHVFDVLRQMQSCAAMGGAMTGRGLMIGLLRRQGIAPETAFNGVGHAPSPLTTAERVAPGEMTNETALDCPAWLAPQLRAALGDDFAAVMKVLQSRAPVFLRVNLTKATVSQAQETLAVDGIITERSPLAETAIIVCSNPRKVQQNKAYRDGLVEIQDGASQAISTLIPVASGTAVLDYCAGGGGKSLALAARCPGATYFAHDGDPARMSDLPARAERADAIITRVTTDMLTQVGPFATVVVDAPCSGSGAWRRSPQGKWLFTQEKLDNLVRVQMEVLGQAARCVAPGGCLAYVTCSLLMEENEDQVARFLKNNENWRLKQSHHFTPVMGGDGFFIAVFSTL